MRRRPGVTCYGVLREWLGWGVVRLLLSCLPIAFTMTGEARSRPDVLFVAIDDMNDWVSLLDPEAPVKTPNLERLAGRGVLFTKAYCVSRPAIHRGVLFSRDYALQRPGSTPTTATGAGPCRNVEPSCSSSGRQGILFGAQARSSITRRRASTMRIPLTTFR